MADLQVPPTIQWEEFLSLVSVPSTARLVSTAKAPDGRSIALIFEGLEARCNGGQQRASTAMFAGSIIANVPANIQWKATRGDFRGETALTEGARATVQIGLAQANSGMTRIGPFDVDMPDINTPFVQTLYSSTDSRPSADQSTSGYAPITVSVQLNLFCDSPNGTGLVVVESVDIELWTQ